MMQVHTDYKFIIAVNKSIETGVALNAAAHVALSLAAQAPDEQKKLMSFVGYPNTTEAAHQISGLSLIVLRRNPEELKKLSILSADFIETMTGGTYEEQLARTQATQEPVYYAVALFAKKEILDPMTKRLSLYF
jgi:hypothetical protein